MIVVDAHQTGLGESCSVLCLFCFIFQGDDIKETVYCLEWIHGRACLGIPNRLKKVYELEGLVYDLYQHIGESVSKTRLIELLTSNSWDYEPKTRYMYSISINKITQKQTYIMKHRHIEI
jgi:hypothetical protein